MESIFRLFIVSLMVLDTLKLQPFMRLFLPKNIAFEVVGQILQSQMGTDSLNPNTTNQFATHSPMSKKHAQPWSL
jgi:hypothetical protein